MKNIKMDLEERQTFQWGVKQKKRESAYWTCGTHTFFCGKIRYVDYLLLITVNRLSYFFFRDVEKSSNFAYGIAPI